MPKKNKFKIICLIFLFMIIIPMLTSCQSTNKNDCLFDESTINSSIFEYDDTNKRTKITFKIVINNNTIYDLDSFSVKTKVYSSNTFIDNLDFGLYQNTKHGKNSSTDHSFFIDGNVDKIELESYELCYRTFGDTYKVELIVSLSVVAFISIFYLIMLIKDQFHLSTGIGNIFDFFDKNSWLEFVLTLPVIYICYGFGTESWVSSLIVIGSIILQFLLILFMHLIQFFIEKIDEKILLKDTENSEIKDSEKMINSSINNIENSLNNIEKLSKFTLLELKEYCRDKGISGYSNLKKADIIDLISTNNLKLNSENVNKNSTNQLNKITFNDIAGLDKAKQAFKEKVVFAFKHKELYEKYDKKVGGGILLYGLPGTGKTMFAEAASNETDALFIPIKCSDIKSKWYGESEANIEKIFEKARKAEKAIIFFDEFDAIGSKRSDDADDEDNDLVTQILTEMQGINLKKSKSVIVVIAATNKPWIIDSAFLRPGRFDEKIYIPLPDATARAKMCELKLKKVPTKDIDYLTLANLTNGFNGADITEFCEKIKMDAIRKSLAENSEHIITMEDAMAISKTVKSSVLKKDIEQLKLFESKF